MWLITTFGFFSVVEKPEQSATGMVTIRARVKRDLEELRERYLPEMGKITGKASDYPYRAIATKSAVAQAIKRAVLDIDYENFKATVLARQGSKREMIYSEVWSVLQRMEEREQAMIVAKTARPKPSGRVSAAGGVFFNDAGELLLRKPKGQFGGYAWTFGKGTLDPGESAEAGAVREVLEETGVRCSILAELGDFAGDTSITRFYLMQVIKDTGRPNPDETEAVQWVTPPEARKLIAQTSSPRGRARDLAILDAAVAMRKRLLPRTKP